jgi:hypothetical protein
MLDGKQALVSLMVSDQTGQTKNYFGEIVEENGAYFAVSTTTLRQSQRTGRSG